MFPERIKIGVIGLGIGRWHIESYLAIPEAKVSAICDADDHKLKTITTRYGITKVYNNYEELCQSDSIDAVSICVPNYMHSSIVICALENGKHVLCEPPIATTVDDAEKLLRKVNESTDLKIMTAMKLRFSKDVIYTKQIIDNGDIGKINYGFARYSKQLNKAKKEVWYNKKNLSGGGTLIDNGLQVLDLAWWLMGCPIPEETFGITYTNHNSDVEELATGIIRFKNKSSILLESAWDMPMDKEIIKTRLCGTKGIADLWPLKIYYKDNEKITSKKPELEKINSENQFKHFINCIINDKKPIANINQAVIVLKMLDAIYRSSEKGKSMTILGENDAEKALS